MAETEKSKQLDKRRAVVKAGAPLAVYEPPEAVEPDPVLIGQLPIEYPSEGMPHGSLRGQRSRGTGARKWRRETAAEVLLRISMGATMREVAARPGMPSANMWSRWCMSVPKLREMYREAQLLRASAAFDEAIDVARDLVRSGASSEETQAARVLIETLKWAAAKLSPKEFGERGGDQPFISVKIYSDLDLNFMGSEGRQGEIIDLDNEDDEVTYSLRVPAAVPATEALANQGGDGGTSGGHSAKGRRPALKDGRRAGKRAKRRAVVEATAKELEK